MVLRHLKLLILNNQKSDVSKLLIILIIIINNFNSMNLRKKGQTINKCIPMKFFCMRTTKI